jgi:hypothetical protein
MNNKLLLIFGLVFIFTSQAWPQAVAPDPTRLSVGPRVLAMGKAFVGLADDYASIYTNPAGLGNIVDKWELSSMSGNFMEDYQYLNLTGVYPTQYGVFGLAYANSSISGGYATKIKPGTEADPVYEMDTSQPTISYGNNAALLSFGRKVEIPRITCDTLLGANLKMFFASMGGDGITNGGASGQELDLGLLIKPCSWFSFGSTIQNILPSSMGGKLTYSSGHYESYPAVWENGIALRILGDKNSLKTIGEHQLKWLLDLDINPTKSNFPMIYHTGFEWNPMKMIAIRAGIDQDASGDGTNSGNLSAVSNFTAGLGLNWAGVCFDYAYHQFSGVPGVSNNFFSLSYSQPIKPPGPSKWEELAKQRATSSSEAVIKPEVKNEPVIVQPKIVKPPVNKGGPKNVKKKKPVH